MFPQLQPHQQEKIVGRVLEFVGIEAGKSLA
jgi:hypothetical protein